MSHNTKILDLFYAILIKTCGFSKPHRLGKKFKDDLTENFLHKAQFRYHNIVFNDYQEIHNSAMIDIESLMLYMGGADLE